MSKENSVVDDRLTTKHIKTLQYLQDVVSENKELKLRLTELEVSNIKYICLHYFGIIKHYDLYDN